MIEKYLTTETDEYASIKYITPELTKFANITHPGILNFISQLQSQSDKTYVLINALGAGEFWGNNSQGDYFPEAALSHEGPKYGYQTFPIYGHVFSHHQHIDPSMAYGKVIYSAYDNEMHRILIIAELINDNLPPELLTNIISSTKLAVSMGCRNPYDVCSICGNIATKVSDHCDHIKYNLKQILPNGKKVYMINPEPQFFDISFVTIGADKTSYLLSKVAEENAQTSIYIPYIKPMHDTRIAEDKFADIIKTLDQEFAEPITAAKFQQVSPSIISSIDNEPSIDKDILDKLCQLPMPTILSAFRNNGIIPHDTEFSYIMNQKLGIPGAFDNLPAPDLSSIPDSVTRLFTSSENSNDGNTLLAPYQNDRAIDVPHLTVRLLILRKTADGATAYPLPPSATILQQPTAAHGSLLMPAALAAAGLLLYKLGLFNLAANGRELLGGIGLGASGSIIAKLLADSGDRPMQKQAISPTLLRAGISLPIFYTLSSIFRRQAPYAHQGFIKRMIREHPGLSTAAISIFGSPNRIINTGKLLFRSVH